MDLRDQFAMHIAAALVGALRDPDDIARRSYTLAEAMLAERDRRIDADERRGSSVPPASGEVRDDRAGHAAHADVDPGFAAFEHHAALLDEPAPMEEEADIEPPYDPAWELEPVVKLDAAPPASEVEPTRPGLARTQPGAEEPANEREERRERSA